MSSMVTYPLALAATFIWLGFVGAISFMEAWLKFKAPGVSLPIGLGIGKLVFSALNKVEWVLFVGIGANLFWVKEEILLENNLWVLILGLILLIQTFWLSPILKRRADLHIQGQEVPRSNAHLYFIALECIKAICLLAFGIIQLKN